MISIRAANVSDADAIGRVHVQTWQAAYVGQLPDDYLRELSIPARQRSWRERLSDDGRTGDILVAVDHDEVIGFASIGPSRDQEAMTGAGELYGLYLSPDRWNRGIGRRLHDRALEALEQASHAMATLWVLETNDRARQFYERAGWVHDGASKIDTNRDGLALAEIRFARSLSNPRSPGPGSAATRTLPDVEGSR